MTITYTKEIFYRTDDTTELSFASFFNLIDEFVRSNAIRLGPKYCISNQLALYSKKENDIIVLYTMHTTSGNDNVNISKCISDLLTKESNYDYYVAATNIMVEGGTSEDKGKSYPSIQLLGQDPRSEDIQQEKTKRKVYRINFGQSQMSMIGFEWLHEIKF